MEVENRLMDFYKRWNIQFSYEEQFEKFKNRLISLLSDSIGNSFASTLDYVDQKFQNAYLLAQAQIPSVKKSNLYLSSQISPASEILKDLGRC